MTNRAALYYQAILLHEQSNRRTEKKGAVYFRAAFEFCGHYCHGIALCREKTKVPHAGENIRAVRNRPTEMVSAWSLAAIFRNDIVLSARGG